ncbi:MAG: tagatose 1,6-diphosphate aldolase [Aggregatilineales bacterium]
MAKAISIGKFRALQRASTADGIFTVLAIDHQDSLRRALNSESPDSVTDAEMIAFKMQVVSTLWDEASGVLLDPVYGTAQIIAQGLPKQVGLLAELEKADYNMQPLPLAVDIRPHWSVSKIKRMGADGVKLFYYYDPDDAHLCAKQDATIQQVVADCTSYDIPLYAEPIITDTSPENRQRKVIESAVKSDQLGADILKLEFPLDVRAYPDHADWQSACESLSQATNAPWVLLSAGVDFEIFCQQVEIACKAGACGYIVGRAVWGDACTIAEHDAREHWLKSTGRERLHRLNAIAAKYATSWTTIYQPAPINTTWYADYPDFNNMNSV